MNHRFNKSQKFGSRDRVLPCTFSSEEKREIQLRRGAAKTNKGTILVAVDFSDQSVKAIDYAISIAKAQTWSIVLLHVVERGYAEGFLEMHVKKQLQGEKRRQGQKQLNSIASSRAKKGVAIRCMIRSGAPEHMIPEIAKMIKAEMIIIGKRRETRLSSFFYGSVAKQVMHAAPCPVLIVPDGDRKTAGSGKVQVNRWSRMRKRKAGERPPNGTNTSLKAVENLKAK